MTLDRALLAGLEAQLWQGPLSDPAAPEQELVAALAAGASYRQVEQALRKLRRLGLPGFDAAQTACARWPGSVDFAVLALDFAAPAQQAAALAHLEQVVLRANRRRAALAQAYLQLGQTGHADQVLAGIDPASETACADLQFRAAYALDMGQLAVAAELCARLRDSGYLTEAEALGLRQAYLAGGAKAMSEMWSSLPQPARHTCRTVFEISLTEGDFGQAQQVLIQWHSVGATLELARARTRLALEQGDVDQAQALLQARLDPEQPWGWDAVDHVHWLRCAMLAGAAPESVAARAFAVARLWPRHDWLAHLARMAHEALADWRLLVPEASAQPARAVIAAQAALRMGLSGHAARLIAPVRRAGAAPLRVHLLRADALWQAGRLSAAWQAQSRSAPQTAPEQAERALLAAELALMLGDPIQADAALSKVASQFPKRMALWLTRARIAFQCGDFAGSVAAHAQFNQLKAQQIGPFVPRDVRDRITEDAAEAAQGCASAFDLRHPVTTSIAEAGFARIAASPGLSACLLQRAQAQGALGFRPDPTAAIPRRIVHYWQGPPGPAVPRALEQWRRLHPGFENIVFTAESAADWLGQHVGAGLQAQFMALAQPALRADLFRLCWIAREGGIFADLDEFPRLPITPWLHGARAVFCIERGFGTVANNFLAAVPGHPICLQAQDLVLGALKACADPYPWWHSGPAQWTRAVFAHVFGADAEATQRHGLRFLSQMAYNRRIATNLPYPHKRRPDHWR